eukprot:tig00000128_g7207.t1
MGLSKTLSILTVEVLAVLAFEFVALPALAGSETLNIAGSLPPAFAEYYAKYIKSINDFPLETKIATSAVGCLLGNLISQLPKLSSFSPLETIRFVLFGALLHGPICHYWYGFIETVLYPHAPSSPEAIIVKTAFDQIVFAPVFTSLFFIFMEFAKLSPGNSLKAVRSNLGGAMLMNWTIWPVAHLVSFRYIPFAARALFLNAVQVLFNVLLSSLASSGSKGEAAAGAKKRSKKTQ